MNTIIERITEAIKDILIGLIKSSLDNMFTSVNEQVGTIAGQVGQTPQGWNAGIFNLIQNISQTVIVPIAGLIITFVLCYELITMVTQKTISMNLRLITFPLDLQSVCSHLSGDKYVQYHDGGL